MMLDAERVVETKLVAQRELTPQLLVALVRRHSGLAPDMGEMREFHGWRAPYVSHACRVRHDSSNHCRRLCDTGSHKALQARDMPIG